MKFSNGFWQVREEITPLYAAEYADSQGEGGGVKV
jgi:hypothetical protein